MTWSKVSNTDSVRETRGLVDEVVTMFRNRGHSRAIALEQTALALGLSERKARSILYDEFFAVTAAEFRAIRQRYIDTLDDELDCLAARLDAVKMKRDQVEIDI